jgi:hypothetical protein
MPTAKEGNKGLCNDMQYAVDGLGFYYFPHQALSKLKGDQNAAIILLIEGSITADQVVAEMDHLVPGTMKWAVQEVDRNTFRTNFQSKAELNRMVEWGMVQTMDRLAKMIIGEGNRGSHFKHALHRVWVHMSGLLEELREYLAIWAIGTIFGATKDVDMKFTHEYDRARLQVLFLDPSLIPHSIDVVIEFIYELHFRVERDEMMHPTPIDMDDDTMEE